MDGMVVLVVVLAAAVVALSYRLWKLRQGGTAGIMRDIPAVGGHGWRHGVIRSDRFSFVARWATTRIDTRFEQTQGLT